MTLRRVVVSVSVVAVGVLGLSACGGEEPSGLAPFTPSATSTSSTPTPTSTSKWTPEQQRVIDGYDRFTELQTALSTKTQKIDVARARRVAQEPYATKFLKDIDATLSAGYVQSGKVVSTISSVRITGSSAIIKTCYDATHTKYTKPGNASAPLVEMRPPSMATVSTVLQGDSWLVSGFKSGEGPCVSG